MKSGIGLYNNDTLSGYVDRNTQVSQLFQNDTATNSDGTKELFERLRPMARVGSKIWSPNAPVQ
jgi:hypothetical protein